MNSHYDSNTPGQYTPPPPAQPRPKKRMPLWAKIVAGILAVPVLVVGGCTAVTVGSIGAETIAGQADETPVVSADPTPTVAPTYDTPRPPKPVEEAPPTTKPKPTQTVPAVSAGQEQALRAAEQYLAIMPLSRRGLIEQLSSSAGEGFSVKDATYAADHVEVDWNEQAVKAAKQYLELMPMSRAGLIHQLESRAGDGFTHAQAVHGAKGAGL